MPYSHLFKAFKVKELILPNRIVMAPMGNNFSGLEGIVTPRTTAYYLERARGGVGMIITEVCTKGSVSFMKNRVMPYRPGPY